MRAFQQRTINHQEMQRLAAFARTADFVMGRCALIGPWEDYSALTITAQLRAHILHAIDPRSPEQAISSPFGSPMDLEGLWVVVWHEDGTVWLRDHDWPLAFLYLDCHYPDPWTILELAVPRMQPGGIICGNHAEVAVQTSIPTVRRAIGNLWWWQTP